MKAKFKFNPALAATNQVPDDPKQLRSAYLQLAAAHDEQTKEYEDYQKNSQELACMTIALIVGALIVLFVMFHVMEGLRAKNEHLKSELASATQTTMVVEETSE